ncbi:MAG: Uma2 family endonuclease [Planctomycetota bacterium]|jgi:Uma2 family endonuclease
MSVSETRLMTIEEFLALPDDDGIDRELIRGELREGERDMTRRNRTHAWIESCLSKLLGMWLDEHPELGCDVYAGEVGCVLHRDPATAVGIDVVVSTAEQEQASIDAGTTQLEGPPLLAVEILSPSDKLEDVGGKVDLYLESGVQIVWLIEPHFQTVEIHKPGMLPVQLNTGQEIADEPLLPGLRIPVARVFRRK